MQLGDYILEKRNELLSRINDEYKEFVSDYLEETNECYIVNDFYEFAMGYDFTMNELMEWLNNDLENNINYVDLAMCDSDLISFHSLLFQARIMQISAYLGENEYIILSLVFLKLLWDLDDYILEQEMPLEKIDELDNILEYRVFEYGFRDLDKLINEFFGW